jgi:hypothetical protein
VVSLGNHIQYIEMELATYPDSTHAPILKQARELAHEHIEGNPNLVLRSVHTDTSENYNPALNELKRHILYSNLKSANGTPLSQALRQRQGSSHPLSHQCPLWSML